MSRLPFFRSLRSPSLLVLLYGVLSWCRSVVPRVCCPGAMRICCILVFFYMSMFRLALVHGCVFPGYAVSEYLSICFLCSVSRIFVSPASLVIRIISSHYSLRALLHVYLRLCVPVSRRLTFSYLQIVVSHSLVPFFPYRAIALHVALARCAAPGYLVIFVSSDGIPALL